MLNNIYQIFSIISSIAVIFASFFAVYQYKQQKKSELKTAFTSIVNEINQIDSVVYELYKLSDNGNLKSIDLYSSAPVIEENYWNRYKHLVMKELDQTDIKVLDEFYYNATQIERARKEISHDLAQNWLLKAQTMLNEKLEILKKSMEKPEDDTYFYKFYNDAFTFLPGVPYEIFLKYFTLYRPIMTSVTYKKLVELSYFK